MEVTMGPDQGIAARGEVSAQRMDQTGGDRDAGVQAGLLTYGVECGLVGQCYITS